MRIVGIVGLCSRLGVVLWVRLDGMCLGWSLVVIISFMMFMLLLTFVNLYYNIFIIETFFWLFLVFFIHHYDIVEIFNYFLQVR